MKFFQANKPMKINRLVTILYGEAGVGKTSLAASAERPLLLDFDKGVHRSEVRTMDTIQLDWREAEILVTPNHPQDTDNWYQRMWKKPAEDGNPRYRTVIIDTVGKATEALEQQICDEGVRNNVHPNGLTLSPAGYGLLAKRFIAWLKRLLELDVDIILVGHSVLENVRNGDETMYMPSLVGKKSGEYLLTMADQIGYMHMQQDQRVVSFEPGQFHVGKDTAGLGTLLIEDYDDPQEYAIMQDVMTAVRNKVAGKPVEKQSTEATEATEADIFGKLTSMMAPGKTVLRELVEKYAKANEAEQEQLVFMAKNVSLILDNFVDQFSEVTDQPRLGRARKVMREYHELFDQLQDVLSDEHQKVFDAQTEELTSMQRAIMEQNRESFLAERPQEIKNILVPASYLSDNEKQAYYAEAEAQAGGTPIDFV
jgi:hypothetical protein